MADKAPAPKSNFQQEIILLLFGILFLSLLVSRIEDYSLYVKAGGGFRSVWDAVLGFFVVTFIPVMKLLGFFVSIFSIFGLIYLYGKYRSLVKEEQDLYGLSQVPIRGSDAIPADMRNKRWEGIIEHINSANASDWRLAIIEADIMLEEMLRAAGYHGESIGEMLKAVEASDFTNIESAWQAHKIRNRIAHSGIDFRLNEREAKQAIALYEDVFREFKII